MSATVNRWAKCFLVVSVFCCTRAARAETIPPQPLDGKIKWVYSYQKGKQLARESGKALFVVFRCER